MAGISRSVTITAAYIISVTGVSVAEALQSVRSSRTIANPNFGFQKQLCDFGINGAAEKVRLKLKAVQSPFKGLKNHVHRIMRTSTTPAFRKAHVCTPT